MPPRTWQPFCSATRVVLARRGETRTPWRVLPVTFTPAAFTAEMRQSRGIRRAQRLLYAGRRKAAVTTVTTRCSSAI